MLFEIIGNAGVPKNCVDVRDARNIINFILRVWHREPDLLDEGPALTHQLSDTAVDPVDHLGHRVSRSCVQVSR